MLTKEMLEKIGTELRNLGRRVQETSVEESRCFSVPFEAIRCGQSLDQLKRLESWAKERKSAQYLYRLTVSSEVDVSQLRSAFETAKNQKAKGRAYARLQQVSETLYVGSSRSLTSRIKQHLGFGWKGTYAVQMSHWLPEIPGSLHIEVCRFREGTDVAVVQAIEDGLWSFAKPMFGRQGAK